jgi:hypothetical protein
MLNWLFGRDEGVLTILIVSGLIVLGILAWDATLLPEVQYAPVAKFIPRGP